MNHKHRAVISSYSDLSKISSNVKIIHFRKFVSKKILNIVLERCPNLISISLSKYASKRLNSKILKMISNKDIKLKLSSEKGRPNKLRKYYINIVI